MSVYNDLRLKGAAATANATDGLYALELRSEVLQTITHANDVRRGRSDRLEIGSGSGDNGSTDTVEGTETVTVGGNLTETVGRERTNTLGDLTTTVHGRMSLDANQESFMMTGTFNETHRDGELLVAGMSDDLIGGIGVRTTAPADLWLNGLIGMEEKLATANNDVLMMDVYAVGMEREFGTSIHNIGCASIGGAVYTTAASGFMQLHQIQRGLRNTVPGGAGGSSNAPSGAPAPTPPPAPPPATDGGASGMVVSGARSAGGIDDLVGAEDLSNARQLGQTAESAGDAPRPNLAATVEDLRGAAETPDEGGRRAGEYGEEYTHMDPAVDYAPGNYTVMRNPRRKTEPNIRSLLTGNANSRARSTSDANLHALSNGSDAPLRAGDLEAYHADVPAHGDELSPTAIGGGNGASAPGLANAEDAQQRRLEYLWADAVTQFIRATEAHHKNPQVQNADGALNLMATAKTYQAIKEVEDDALKLYPHFAKYSNVSESELSGASHRLLGRMRRHGAPTEALGADFNPMRLYMRRGRYDFRIRNEYVNAVLQARIAGDVEAAAKMTEVIDGLDARAAARLDASLEEARRLQQWQGTPLPQHIDQDAVLANLRGEIELTDEKLKIIGSGEPLADGQNTHPARADDFDHLMTRAYRQALEAAEERVSQGLYPMPYVDEFTTHYQVYYPNSPQGHWQLQGVTKARRNLIEWMSRHSSRVAEVGTVSEGRGFLDNYDSLRQAQAQYKEANVPSQAATDVLKQANADVQQLSSQQLAETSEAVGLPFPGFAHDPVEARAGFGELYRELTLTGQHQKAWRVASDLAQLDTAADVVITDALVQAGRLAVPPPLPETVDLARADEALTGIQLRLRIEAWQLTDRKQFNALDAQASLYGDVRNRVRNGIDPRTELEGQIKLLTEQGRLDEAHSVQDVLAQVDEVLKSSQESVDGIYDLPTTGALDAPQGPDPVAAMKPAELELGNAENAGVIQGLIGAPGEVTPTIAPGQLDAVDALGDTDDLTGAARLDLSTEQVMRELPPTPAATPADEAGKADAMNDGIYAEVRHENQPSPDGDHGSPGIENDYEAPRLGGDYDTLQHWPSHQHTPRLDGDYDALQPWSSHYETAQGPGYYQVPQGPDPYQLPLRDGAAVPPQRRHSWSHFPSAGAGSPIDNPSHTIPRASAPQSLSNPQPTLNHRRASWADPYLDPIKRYDEAADPYMEPVQQYDQAADAYMEPVTQYAEPEGIYSEPEGIYSEPEGIYESLPNTHDNPDELFQGTTPAAPSGAGNAADQDYDEVPGFDDLWATAIHRRELSSPDLPYAPAWGTGHLRTKANLIIESTLQELSEFMLDIYRRELPEGASEEPFASIGRTSTPPSANTTPNEYLSANPQSRLTARDEYVKAIGQQTDPDIRLQMERTLASFDRVAERELERALEQADYAMNWQAVPLQEHVNSTALTNFTARRQQEHSDAFWKAMLGGDNATSPTAIGEIEGQQEVFITANRALQLGHDPVPFVNQVHQNALFKAAQATDGAKAQAFADGAAAARRELLDWLGNSTNWSHAPTPNLSSGYQEALHKLTAKRWAIGWSENPSRAAIDLLDETRQYVQMSSQDAYRRITELHGSKVPENLAWDGSNLTPQAVRRNLDALQYHLSHAGHFDAALDVQRATEQLDVDLGTLMRQKIAEAEQLAANPGAAYAEPGSASSLGETPPPFDGHHGSAEESPHEVAVPTEPSDSSTSSPQGSPTTEHGSAQADAADASPVDPAGEGQPAPATDNVGLENSSDSDLASWSDLRLEDPGNSNPTPFRPRTDSNDSDFADLRELGLGGDLDEPGYAKPRTWNNERYFADPSVLTHAADSSRNQHVTGLKGQKVHNVQVTRSFHPGRLVLQLRSDVVEAFNRGELTINAFTTDGQLIDPSHYRIVKKGERLLDPLQLMQDMAAFLDGRKAHFEAYDRQFARAQAVGDWAVQIGNPNGTRILAADGARQEDIAALIDGIPARTGGDGDSPPRRNFDYLPTPEEEGYGDFMANNYPGQGGAGEGPALGDGQQAVPEPYPEGTDVHALATDDIAAARGRVASIDGQLVPLAEDAIEGYPGRRAETETGGQASLDGTEAHQADAPSEATDLLFANATELHAADEITSEARRTASLMRSVEPDGRTLRLQFNSLPAQGSTDGANALSTRPTPAPRPRPRPMPRPRPSRPTPTRPWAQTKPSPATNAATADEIVEGVLNGQGGPAWATAAGSSSQKEALTGNRQDLIDWGAVDAYRRELEGDSMKPMSEPEREATFGYFDTRNPGLAGADQKTIQDAFMTWFRQTMESGTI